MDSAAAERGLALGPQDILFVGGKGGVGKTTTASAIALRLAQRGQRCLIVSTDPAHSLGDLWDRRVGDEVTRLADSLWGLEIDPEAQVAGHIEGVERSALDLVRPGLHAEVRRQMKLARLAPGAVEAAMLERIAELMTAGDSRFDRVIFDTAPTGHTLRLLSLPEIMAAWTDGLLRSRDRSDSWNAAIDGLRRRSPPGSDLEFVETDSPTEDDRSRRIRELLLERRRKFHQARRLLLDPRRAGFILVLVPEKLPILESRKAVDALREAGVTVLALVVNRVLPSDPLGDFLEARRAQEGQYLNAIDRLFATIPRVSVPLRAQDVTGIEALRSIADDLLP